MGVIRMNMPENWDDLGWRKINNDDPSTFPNTDKLILLNIENFSHPLIGRCEGNENDGFTFYEGDDDMPLVLHDLYVTGWMPLPKKMEEYE